MTGRRNNNNNNRNNRGRPQQQGNMNGGADGPRYVPPQMRDGADIIRPESSMSNMSAHTFASQVPYESNYSYGPSNLTNNMSAYNPFAARHPHPFMAAAQVRPGFPPMSVVSDASSGMPPPPSSCGVPIRGRINGVPVNMNPPIIAQPTPVRRDSGAPPQSTAEYLASRIKNGDAESPYDPDYGNPGPTKAPPPPEPVPYPTQKLAAQPGKVVAPKVGGDKNEDDIRGNSAAFLGSVKITIPEWYFKTKAGFPPTLERVFEDLPFVEAHRIGRSSNAGVVKITNVPYATSRTEVNGFLGRQTQLCHQPQGTGFYAVHLVMDRHSGKTMDAFVEVSTPTEAVWVVNQFQKRVMQKRPGKIGDRVVGVELSSQDELMATIFPRAKQVTWEGGVPKVDMSRQTYYPGVQSTGFNGFLQDEEIVHIKKHAETPQRSPFVERNKIRTYEYLISTLHKYPWFAHEHVLLSERDALYDATLTSLRCLIKLVRATHHDKGGDSTKPTTNTLAELAMAVFVCPGFTDTQKAAVADLLRSSGFGKMTEDKALNLRFGGVDKFAKHMPFLALVKKPGVDDGIVEYLATTLKDATVDMAALSLADLHAMRATNGNKHAKLFGELDVDYRGVVTLADAGRAELRYLESVLGRVLARANPSSGVPSSVHSSRVPSLAGSRGSGSGLGGGLRFN